MDEHLEFSPKVKEILGRIGLTRFADVLIIDWEWMRTWAETCHVQKALRTAGDAQETYMRISIRLDEAISEGRISYDEWKLANSELERLRNKYIEITAHILKENCGCEVREKWD